MAPAHKQSTRKRRPQRRPSAPVLQAGTSDAAATRAPVQPPRLPRQQQRQTRAASPATNLELAIRTIRRARLPTFASVATANRQLRRLGKEQRSRTESQRRMLERVAAPTAHRRQKRSAKTNAASTPPPTNQKSQTAP